MLCRFVGCLALSAALALAAGCGSTTPTAATQPTTVTSVTSVKHTGHSAAPVMEEKGTLPPRPTP